MPRPTTTSTKIGISKHAKHSRFTDPKPLLSGENAQHKTSSSQEFLGGEQFLLTRPFLRRALRVSPIPAMKIRLNTTALATIRVCAYSTTPLAAAFDHESPGEWQRDSIKCVVASIAEKSLFSLFFGRQLHLAIVIVVSTQLVVQKRIAVKELSFGAGCSLSSLVPHLRQGLNHQMSEKIDIRQMTRDEVDDLVRWAALEGWNPGLHDAGIFWETDPEAFIAAELDGEVIGGGAITAYGGEFGFMGFFVVRPEFRRRGFGDTLWHARRDRLIARLDPGASIGMDGVFDMQPYYAKGGFDFSHRNIRYRFVGTPSGDETGAIDETILDLGDVPFDEVQAYDRTCFPAARPSFLRAWISQPEAGALGIQRQGRLCGYGVIRRCLEGYKVGPLFADDERAATTLYARFVEFAEGDPIFLDVPENNPAAMSLVRRFGMDEVFGCARMYLGPAPDLHHHRIFGVTTFELG